MDQDEERYWKGLDKCIEMSDRWLKEDADPIICELLMLVRHVYHARQEKDNMKTTKALKKTL